MKLNEEKISSEEIFNGVVVHLFVDRVLLPDGKQANREILRHSGAVGIIPITEDNKVIMVKQFRYPFNRVVLEIPAGKLEKGEDPLECAKRELSEETGAEGGELIYIGDAYSSPAIMDEVIHLYIAKNFKLDRQHTDPEEFIQVEAIPFEELFDMVLTGKIKDGKTQIALMKAYFHIKGILSPDAVK